MDIDEAFDTVQAQFAEGVGCRLQLVAGIYAGVEEEKEIQDNHITDRLNAGVVGCRCDTCDMSEELDGDGFQPIGRRIRIGLGPILEL